MGVEVADERHVCVLCVAQQIKTTFRDKINRLTSSKENSQNTVSRKFEC